MPLIGPGDPGGEQQMMSGPRDPGNPLKVSIALGQKPAIIQKGPFYLMKVILTST